MHANEKALQSWFISQKFCRCSVARMLYNLNMVGVILGATIAKVLKNLFSRHASLIHVDKMVIDSSMQHFASKSAHGLRALLVFLCFMSNHQFTGPLAGGALQHFFCGATLFSCSAKSAFSCTAVFFCCTAGFLCFNANPLPHFFPAVQYFFPAVQNLRLPALQHCRFPAVQHFGRLLGALGHSAALIPGHLGGALKHGPILASWPWLLVVEDFRVVTRERSGRE